MSAFLPKDYGYCFSVLGGSMFMNIYLTIQVALARQKVITQFLVRQARHLAKWTHGCGNIQTFAAPSRCSQ